MYIHFSQTNTRNNFIANSWQHKENEKIRLPIVAIVVMHSDQKEGDPTLIEYAGCVLLAVPEQTHSFIAGSIATL